METWQPCSISSMTPLGVLTHYEKPLAEITIFTCFKFWITSVLITDPPLTLFHHLISAIVLIIIIVVIVVIAAAAAASGCHHRRHHHMHILNQRNDTGNFINGSAIFTDNKMVSFW